MDEQKGVCNKLKHMGAARYFKEGMTAAEVAAEIEDIARADSAES